MKAVRLVQVHADLYLIHQIELQVFGKRHHSSAELLAPTVPAAALYPHISQRKIRSSS